MPLRLFALITVVFVGIFARLLPHAPNFTPILAMGMVAGAFARPRWVGLASTLVALYLSDLVLNNVVYAEYYEGFRWFGSPAVYLGMALACLLPVLMRARGDSSWSRLGGLGVVGTALFFLVSNLGVWMSSGMYPLTPAGLLACYAAGIPFALNSLAATLVFGSMAVVLLRRVYSDALRPANG